MTRKLSARRDRKVAFHEAGHAVASWFVGHVARKVTIEAEGDSDGHVLHHYPRWFVNDMNSGATSARTQKRIEDAIVISLAGTIAQHKGCPGSVRHYQGREDRLNAAQLADAVCWSDIERFAFIKWLRIRAETLIRAKWDIVDAVARTLIRERTLSREKLKAIVVAVSDASQARRLRRRVDTTV